MSWSPSQYEKWFSTPQGSFALRQEQRLLDCMVAGWPRRKRSLLEAGCGTGIFLKTLWDLGFDVTGVDRSQAMLEGARTRVGGRADLHVANAENLPFSDNEFDYVVLWTVLEFCSDPIAALSEAARVAETGVLIGFLNRYSLNRMLNPPGGTLSRATFFTWPEMRRMVDSATGYDVTMALSVLVGPESTWKDTAPWGYLNSRLFPPWVGTFTALRIDFKDLKPFTPLPAWAEEPEAS